VWGLVRFVVLLVEPEFESTIGFLARAMKNFGLEQLRLVNPIAGIGREAHMRASHAQEVLEDTRTFTSLRSALADVHLSVGTTAQRSTSIYRIIRKPVTTDELVQILDDISGTVGLVFGREGTGLRNDELEQCDLTLTIQASPYYPTLNLSHAAAIIFHQLYTTTSRSNKKDLLAGKLVKEKTLETVDKISSLVGLPQRNRTLVVKAFRSAMGRAGLRAREASLIAGFFRRVQAELAEEDGKNYATMVPKNAGTDVELAAVLGD